MHTFACDANNGCRVRKQAIGLQSLLCMLGRKPKARRTKDGGAGTVDGGEGRGVPLGGHDERPPTGYLTDEPEMEITDNEDPALFWEEEDPADRRRDPLRKP